MSVRIIRSLLRGTAETTGPVRWSHNPVKQCGKTPDTGSRGVQ